MNSHALRKDRGMRLHAARRRASLSAEELARRVAASTQGRVKFTTSAVYNWEKARNLLPVRTAREIARVLQCEEIELLGEHGRTFLERIPLAASASHLAPVTPDQLPDIRATTDLNITLSVGPVDGSAPPRERSWAIRYDARRKVLIVRGAPGTSPVAVAFALPEGEEPYRFASNPKLMGMLPDPSDFSTMHVACDLADLLANANDGRVLRLDVRELLGLEDFQRLLQPADSAMSLRGKVGRVTKDKEVQVADFLDEVAARRLCAMWEEGSDYLERYLADVLPREVIDPYSRNLVTAVAYLGLNTNFDRALGPCRVLVELAGDDPRQLCDAHYLLGRCLWYLKQDKNRSSLFPEAVQHLGNCYKYALRIGNEIRAAQAAIYQARISIDSPNFASLVTGAMVKDADELLGYAHDVGCRHKRPDIEILAARSRIVRLYQQKRYDDVVEQGKDLLRRIRGEREAGSGFDLGAIGDYVSVHVGMALRRRGTEEGRSEAELLYAEGIEKGNDDSHAGMCCYLTGDLEVDRAQAAAQEAVSLELTYPDDAKKSWEKAQHHQREASSWYDRAERILYPRGDRAAKEKATYRTLWVRNQELPKPATRQVAVDSAVARQQRLVRELLGRSFLEPTTSIAKSVIEELLSTRFLDTTPTDVHFTADVADYIDDRTLLVLPWLAGDALNIQLLAQHAEKSDHLTVVGWMVIKDYATNVRRLLRKVHARMAATDWEEEDWDRFSSLSDQLWEAIQDQTRRVSPIRLPKIDKALILAPDDPLDALLPFECLSSLDDGGLSLLDRIEVPIVYAGPWAPALRSFEVCLSGKDAGLFCSDDSLAGSSLSLRDAVASELARTVLPLPGRGASFAHPSVMLVCHADSHGQIAELIGSWDFSGVRTVFLLFCGSGAADLVQGPFTTGPAHRVRKALGPEGLVVASRVPVSVDEAIQLTSEMLDEAAEQPIAVATAVSTYVRRRVKEGGNPLSFPWFVL